MIQEVYMHEDKSFRLYNKVLQYDKYIRRNILPTIPKVHRDLKIRLVDESYNLVRYLHEAEYTKGNIRVKNITEMLVTISMLDFITNEISEITSINKKHIESSIRLLTEIKNMTYSWRKNPEPNESKTN